MKLTNEEQAFLRELLRENLQYRETYTEIYDHILTALESKPQNMDFKEAVESIINDDFGGYDGINKTEAHYCNTVRAQMRKTYFTYIKAYLQFPLVWITALLAISFYAVAIQPWFNYGIFIGLLFTMRCIPTLLKWIRHFRLGYMSANAKKSVMDSVFKWLDYVPVMIVLVFLPYLLLRYGQNPTVWFKNTNAFVVTFILLLFALHMLSFYKVYRDEFKAIITRS